MFLRMKLSEILPTSVLSLVLAACGGIAIFDDASAGGAGGASASGTGGMIWDTGVSTNVSSGFGGTQNVSASAGFPADCFTACSMLYQCGLQNGPQIEPLCPGFSGSPQEEQQFVNNCTTGCQDTPLLVQLVDPNNCTKTIQTVSSASQEFDQACHGFGGTPQ
jgi:hypothetical protein